MMEYKHLGLISIIFVWCALLLLITKWRGNNALTISRHASSTKQAYMIFGIAISFSIVLYHIFLTNWFIPNYKLSSEFEILVNTSNIFLLLTLLIPDSDSIFRKIHRFTAHSFAFSLLFVVMYLVLWVDVSFLTKVIGIFAICVMIAIWILFYFVKSSRRNILIYQFLYIFSFQILILSATYF